MLSFDQEEQLKLQKDHIQALSDIQSVLSTNAGKRFFKYLLLAFEVGELPERGLTGEDLADRLGFLRAGQSVFKIMAEADPMQAGLLLGEIEKERYEKALRDYVRQNSK